MKTRLRLPGQPWRGGELRIKRIARYRGHTRMYFSLTDRAGREVSFEMQSKDFHALANAIIDRAESYRLEPTPILRSKNESKSVDQPASVGDNSLRSTGRSVFPKSEIREDRLQEQSR